jgi:GGDEF domain-containing protein
MPNREKMEEIKYDIQNGERIEREGRERARKNPSLDQQSIWDIESRHPDAKTAHRAMMKIVNRLGNESDVAAFIELVLRDHRTLQQSFAGVCLKFLYALADDRYGHDLRNQASVARARIVRDALGSYGDCLPLI